jgi:hypothetical protein
MPPRRRKPPGRSPLAERIRPDGGRQRARHRGDRAIERKLAQHAIAVDGIPRDGPHGDHEAEGNGEVVVAAFLGQVGRRKIDGDAFRRQGKPDGVQRAAHPLAALGHGLVRKADDGEGGQARPDLHLHVDGARLNALEGDRGDSREHNTPVLGSACPRPRLSQTSTVSSFVVPWPRCNSNEHPPVSQEQSGNTALPNN